MSVRFNSRLGLIGQKRIKMPFLTIIINSDKYVQTIYICIYVYIYIELNLCKVIDGYNINDVENIKVISGTGI